MLVDTVVSRGEFLTSYTPYQAEISQGTLTAIFEFQTMICQLTGMDVANASMYDGSTAVPEAAMMAMRATGRGHILVARSVHPEYREVLRTYAQHQGMPVDEFGYDAETGAIDLADLERKIDDAHRRRHRAVAQLLRHRRRREARPPRSRTEHGALLVVVFTEAVSLGILEPPRDADIVAGELQSFAISPSYGGPFAGIIATQRKVHSPDARPAGGRDHGYARQPRVLPDAGHARAAHPPREGDVEHLHQSGADRPDGDGFHDRLRQRRACANWQCRIWRKRITWQAN